MKDPPEKGTEGLFDGQTVYFRLLGEARLVSERAVQGLRQLRNHFPAELPGELIDQVERLRFDPSHERRQSVRLHDTNRPASVADASDLADWQPAQLLDHSIGGAAIRIDEPVQIGAILLLWLGFQDNEKTWSPLQVKHCRYVDDAWIVGGEFLKVTAEWLLEQAAPARKRPRK